MISFILIFFSHETRIIFRYSVNSFPFFLKKEEAEEKKQEEEGKEEIKGFGVYPFTLNLLYSFSNDFVVRIICNLTQSLFGDSYNLNHLN